MIGGIQNSTVMSSDMMAQMREQMFTKLDGDGDGQIDLAQLQSQSQAEGANDDHFTKMIEDLQAADTDGDGYVSQTEFEGMKPPEPPDGNMPPPPPTDEQANLLDFLYTEDGSDTESEYQLGSVLNTLA